MKRTFAILLLVLSILALTACQSKDPPQPATPDPSVSEPQADAVPDAAVTAPSVPSDPAADDSPAVEPPTPETASQNTPLALSYQTNRYYVLHDAGITGYVDYPRIRTDERDCPALSDALDTLSAALYQQAYQLGQTLSARPASASLASAAITQHLVRADRHALSLLYETTRTDGEAPAHSYAAYNFDPASGAELALSDVFTDTAMLPDLLAAQLRAAYPDLAFSDLSSLLALAADSAESEDPAQPKPVWVLGYEGVEFYFAPGLLAEEAFGTLHVTLPYADFPTVIAAVWQDIPTAYAESFAHQSARTLNLGGDAGQTSVLLEIPATLESSTWVVHALELTINGEKTVLPCPSLAAQVQVWLLHLPEGTYLYAQCADLRGMFTLMVVQLTPDGAVLLQTLENTALHMWEQDGANWQNALTDPASFQLDTVDAAGLTQTQTFAAGADGCPVPLSPAES